MTGLGGLLFFRLLIETSLVNRHGSNSAQAAFIRVAYGPDGLRWIFEGKLVRMRLSIWGRFL